MRRASILAAFLAVLTAATSVAETRVDFKNGRVTIQAKGASIPEILGHIRDKTGMRIIYDGAPPQGESIQIYLSDQTPVSAVVNLLEHRAVKYAMVLDGSGTQIDVLLITTAPPPPRREPAFDDPQMSVGGMPDDSYMEEMPQPPPYVPYVPPPPPTPAAVSAAPASPGFPSSPFTPQGQGPIILGPHGGVATPAPTAPPRDPNAGDARSTAEMPPWEKQGLPPPTE